MLKSTGVIAALAMAMTMSTAQADSSIGAVEGARAKERQGAWLTRGEVDNLRRYGSNDDYRYNRRYSYGYPRGAYAIYGDTYDSYDYGYGPSVGIYLGY